MLIGSALSFSMTSVNMSVHVDHVFNDRPLSRDEGAFTNNAGNIISITRLSYILSNFQLQKPDNSWIKLENQYAYINAKEGPTSFELIEVLEDKYKELQLRAFND
ncbi:MAG: hypothetical protein GKR87_02540 [Kiritimatiellae bacterium]|nr:hypothetical protein [Kiritimatiellia bacterium]